MRRSATWSLAPGVAVIGVVAIGAMVVAAAPAPPMPVPPHLHPPLPVPPSPPSEPFLMRMTLSGDLPLRGVFESCADPAAARRTAEAHAKARPADAPPPLAGCDSSFHPRPGGGMHYEMTCDRAKGARVSFRVTSDGTPDDFRAHREVEGVDPATGAPKTMAIDSHIVHVGPCPADLKPGQIRRSGGPVIASSEAAQVLHDAQGVRP